MTGMAAAKTLGNQQVHTFAYELVPRIAELGLRLSVDQYYGSVLIHGHHGIRGRFQEAPGSFLGAPQLGDPPSHLAINVARLSSNPLLGGDVPVDLEDIHRFVLGIANCPPAGP